MTPEKEGPPEVLSDKEMKALVPDLGAKVELIQTDDGMYKREGKQWFRLQSV